MEWGWEMEGGVSMSATRSQNAFTTFVDLFREVAFQMYRENGSRDTTDAKLSAERLHDTNTVDLSGGCALDTPRK